MEKVTHAVTMGNHGSRSLPLAVNTLAMVNRPVTGSLSKYACLPAQSCPILN